MTSAERTSPDLALAITASNRLSQVMDYQAENASSSPSSNIVPSNGTTPYVTLSTSEILSQSPAQTPIPTQTAMPAPSTPATVSVPSAHGQAAPATVTPGMTEYEKSVVSKDMKEKTETEGFINRYAAKQQNGKLLSVEDPFFVKTLAEFRAKQGLKQAIEKQAASVGVEHLVDMDGIDKKKKKKKGRGFKAWLASSFGSLK